MHFKVTQIVVCLPMNRQLPSDTIWASKSAESIIHLWSGSTHGLAMRTLPMTLRVARLRCHVFLQTQVRQHFGLDSVLFDSSFCI